MFGNIFDYVRHGLGNRKALDGGLAPKLLSYRSLLLQA
jgi:hypothetical protein